jgi:RNA polymerase sigma-70 factor (ECF subfamily)
MTTNLPSFDEVYRAYRGYVYSILRRAVQRATHDQLEDLVQETFVKAWKAYERFENRNLKGWLACIARRVALDSLRAAQAQDTRQCVCDETIMQGLADEQEPARARYREESELIAQAFGRLRQDERDLLKLVAQAYTRREIASRLGLNYDACRQRLRRAQQHLREQCQALSR